MVLQGVLWAKMLPPVMFAVTETVLPVCVVALTFAPPRMLPAVMLPVTETVVPVCVVALTLAPPKMLPPVILPVTETVVPVTLPTWVPMMFPPVTLPVVLIGLEPNAAKLAVTLALP